MEKYQRLMLTFIKNMKTKVCTKCRLELPLNKFSKNKKRNDGLESICKNCKNKYMQKWYKNNKELVSNYNKKYRKINSFELNKKNKEWCDKNVEAIKKYRHEQDIKFLYGITREQYNQMLEQQNGVCAICGKEESTCHGITKKITNLAVDHNHKTGKVRGLLCSYCNKALGGFKDNEEFLIKAIEYLKGNK